MIKPRSPQIRISFQRAANKTALLAFATQGVFDGQNAKRS